MLAAWFVVWGYATRKVWALPVLACALFFAATAPAWGAEQKRPRHVLLVHSFGSSAPPFTTHSTAFETTIKKELGNDVDLDEVSLDMSRYAQPDMEDAFAEFMVKRISEWQPDVVVPIGSPAGRFVSKYRIKLFPATPVIYTGMDRRTLPADAFANNATFVGEDFDLRGLVDDMLQLDPQTDNVVVILGATLLERYWTTEFQEAFKPFAGRVKFTWVNDLTFEQMLDLVSKLPPHSFVLLGLLMRDASGVTYNEDDALARLHAVSRAPINGMFQHEVGLGIVGGRLYQGELEGEEAGRLAAKILRGQPASDFPPMIIGTRTPLYDWRELTRWRMSESRLTPGSVVLFRQPTTWERYRWHVFTAIAVIAAQAICIFALVVQLRRRRVADIGRRSAEAETKQKRAQLEHVARVATLGQLTATLTHELKQPLHAISLSSSVGVHLANTPEPDIKEIRETFLEISDTTRRATEVIQGMRDMLKRDTAGFTSVDVNRAIHTVERIVYSDAIIHEVSVDLDLSPSLLPVKGDVVQLQQVVLNLMLNAFAAARGPEREGRRVIVRTSLIDGSKVLIEVRDSGIGIAPDKLESIFEPFNTGRPDGLGMGLSISRTIIERHGGKIWAANNPDRGATFSITLPTVAA
ncbi:MAG TPA: HAMP domain-containing sensor histidine kinase [Humisphaera sp.]|jgi:signal transduction histidine kinase|nr:HAMP domain-containing sensor histidine kinase [Humisphaera sp.]